MPHFHLNSSRNYWTTGHPHVMSHRPWSPCCFSPSGLCSLCSLNLNTLVAFPLATLLFLSFKAQGLGTLFQESFFRLVFRNSRTRPTESSFCVVNACVYMSAFWSWLVFAAPVLGLSLVHSRHSLNVYWIDKVRKNSPASQHLFLNLPFKVHLLLGFQPRSFWHFPTSTDEIASLISCPLIEGFLKARVLSDVSLLAATLSIVLETSPSPFPSGWKEALPLCW